MTASMLLEPVKALLIAAAVFVPFERLAGLHRTQPAFRRGWAMDALTGLMNGVLIYAVLLAALGGVNAAAAWSAPQLRHWIAARPLIVQGALALALGDLGVYAIHRLQHRVPWLWRFHAVHHSAEEMDWLVGFRFHPIDLFLLRIASLGPLVALDLSSAAIAIFVGVSGWQAWLVHANVRIPYGPLRWLVVSPEFHHWHHSAEREAYDRNYAGLVASWDVLFGTVFLPAGRMPLHYGIEEHVPAGWIGRFFHPFRSRPDEARSEAATHAPDVTDRDAAPIAH
jgi:sterol desaturase/sphingolipid hydroxylase (fatty acid hydroxylase superfamily)